MFLNSDVIGVICEFLSDKKNKLINKDFYRHRYTIQKNEYIAADYIIIHHFKEALNFISFASRYIPIDFDVSNKLFFEINSSLINKFTIPGLSGDLSWNDSEGHAEEISIYPIHITLYEEVFNYICQAFILLKLGYYIYPIPERMYVERKEDDEEITYTVDILMKYLEYIYINGIEHTEQKIQQHLNEFLNK